MKIGFIGAGKVGIAFGVYLKSKGFEISGYYSRSPASSIKAAELTASRHFMDYTKLSSESDIIFITTGDGEIKGVCDLLALSGALKKGQIVAHMSGALSSEVLKSARDRECWVYSLHPIQSFASLENALKNLPDTYFSIEGDVEKDSRLEELIAKTGNLCFRIAPNDKALYHAATCIFSNFLVALLDEGLQYLNSIGINPREGFSAMLPLIMGTLSNIELLGTANALTGPIARGDSSTIANHMENIELHLPQSLEFYRAMSLKTLQVAKLSKLVDENKSTRLKSILDCSKKGE
jgi:predicted short-subunit dehydrogenase-like oxidoreductase (DUF2520 family)